MPGTMKNLLRSSLVCSALLLFTACAGTGTSTGQATVNTKCPMSGEALGADACTTTFQGNTVGFCCNNCMSKWNGMTDADRKAKLTPVMPQK